MRGGTVMRRHAFTLVELLVALSVLLVIIIATSRIFGTTSKVAALGEASADLQATATAVEKVIRADVERMARDGVLAIQCVAVRNDVNRFQRGNTPDLTGAAISTTSSTAPLLNPTLAPTDFVRCDQVVFFGRGHEASQVYLGTRGGSRSEQAYAVNTYPNGTLKITPEFTAQEFMVRIGHGLQFPSLLVDVNNPNLFPDADTLGSSASTYIPPVPWMWSATPTLKGAYFNGPANGLSYLPSQPEARQWVLSRQVILLADDGNTQITATPTAKNITWFRSLSASNMLPNSATGIAQLGFLSAGTAAGTTAADESKLSIPDSNMFPNRAITASRVDTAATSIAEYRAFVETGSTSANLAKDFNFEKTFRLVWSDKEGGDPSGTGLGFIRNRIFNSLFGGNVSGRTNGMWGYPRAEKVAPSMDRTDSMVSIPLLAGNCSSIQIDWTWSTGTARFETPEGTPLLAQLPANTARSQAIYDVPLAGLTTVRWPVQPFKSQKFPDVTLTPANTFIPITTNTNQAQIEQLLGLPRTIPWFGLPDSIFPIAQRSGVTRLAGAFISDSLTPLSSPSFATPIRALTPLAASQTLNPTATDIETIAIATPPIDCARIEGVGPIINSLDVGTTTKYSIYTYQAIFGPNGDKPYREAKFPGGSERVLRSDYTPWPTALRFTITLHDPKLLLSQGRVFQFVVELPKADR